MTYFGFLLVFILIPIGLLLVVNVVDGRRGLRIPADLRAFPAWAVISAHVLIAVLYTTPWDNYLVATQVWWYDPVLVTGYTLGWVPVEEYTFFILQTLLTGLWLTWVLRHLPGSDLIRGGRGARGITGFLLAVGWILSVWVLVWGADHWNYLTLILVWAIPPVLIQTIFGGDILLYHWKSVLAGIFVPTIYLSLADAFAIHQGIWTISPGQTTGVVMFGVLPLEEFVFFLLTNVLITLGSILVLANASLERWRTILKGIRARQ